MDKPLHSKDYILYDFIYRTLWKRKNYRNRMGLRLLAECDHTTTQGVSGEKNLFFTSWRQIHNHICQLKELCTKKGKFTVYDRTDLTAQNRLFNCPKEIVTTITCDEALACASQTNTNYIQGKKKIRLHLPGSALYTLIKQTMCLSKNL